jgi:hypothetical protein
MFLAAASVAVVFSSAIVSPIVAQTQKRAQSQKATTYSCPMPTDVKSRKPGEI